MNANTRKTTIAALGIVCITVLLLADKVDPTAGLTGITAIVMYILGNGVAAVTGKQVQPVIWKKRTADAGERADDQTDDDDEAPADASS